MTPWNGKWALVTGASAGIGQALAEQLAAGGANLVLTARRKDRLEQLARRLSMKHAIRGEVFAADLSNATAPDEIFTFTRERGIDVDVLVNNAGFGVYGPFSGAGLPRQLEMVRVNVAAVVHLTYLFLPLMIERHRGFILIVASTAAFQGVPYISTYAATKAFDLHFAEGLAEEVRGSGVKVTALCPGSTATEFQAVAGQPAHTYGLKESAEKVAGVGLKALARGKTCAISGVHNWIGVEGQRLAPRWVVPRIAAKLFQPQRSI